MSKKFAELLVTHYDRTDDSNALWLHESQELKQIDSGLLK